MDFKSLAEAWQWAGQHPYVFGVGIIMVSLGAAKLADLVFIRALKTLTKRTSTNVDDAIINQLHRPVQASVVLAAGIVAMYVVVEDEKLADTLSKILYTIALVLWTVVMVRVSRTLFQAVIQARRADHAASSALPLLDNVVSVVLLAHGAFWLFDIWKINVTPLLASAGIVTAAVALASKDTLANFFGGVSIFMDRPYKLGDYVLLESGERGEVVNIGVRSTRILTRDDVLITVPNAVMSNMKIVNQSGMVPRFRLRMAVGVGYDSDPDQVEKELLGCLEGVPEVLAQPTPRVRFRRFGDSALEFELLAWVHDPADRGKVTHLVNKNILRHLGRAGIEIPFPQRVITMPAGRSKPEGSEAEGGDQS